eukprot:Hpha_TRINITY_DN4063_c0_g1::TRINITY_DN4063_c0_g1_i1::g.63798::m.63798/K14209/SLC36A, PAT; solute carrier family 36 (proton-coupled amino acid transporter)
MTGRASSPDGECPPHSPSAAPPKAGLLATLGNSFIAFVGAGILDLPYAFSKAGLGLASAMLGVVAVVSLHCMFLVADCKRHLERKGVKVERYGDLGTHAFGEVGARVVDFCLVVTQVGFCVAYLIFIARNLLVVVPDSPGYRMVVLLLLPGQLVLSTIRHLKFLSWFSLLADFTNLFGLSSIFWYASERIGLPDPHGDDEPRLVADWSRAVFFFGIAIYCYEGIGMVLPIQASMQDPEQFKLIWSLNMLLVTVLFWSFGFVGYLAYGSTVHDTITLDLPAFDYLTAFVRVALCVGLFFTYPVMMFPVYELAEIKFLPQDAASLPPDELERKKTVLRFAIVTFTALVAIAVPSFSVFISLVGSSCCALLAFILPAIFSLKIQGIRPHTLVRESVVIVMGLLGAVIGTYEALQNVMTLITGGA